jgi:hypothetical protein
MTTRDQLRADHPELAAIVDELRPHITSMALYDEAGTLIAGRPPVDPPGTVWISGESFVKMRHYAGVRPALPRSKR